MLKQAIQKLMQQKNLSSQEMQAALDDMLNNNNEAQAGAFLTLLSAKGETAEEVCCMVNTLHEKMHAVQSTIPLLDIVGTGGDGANTINISTGSAILAAACGVKVAKHGNRSVSSLSGSADVLEALSVEVNLPPSAVTNCIDKTNFGFCYAPKFHPVLNELKPLRKKLGVPTIFNILGPLLNPAKAAYLMIGIAKPEQLSLVASIVSHLDIQHALVFHCAGLDELCCVAPVEVMEVYNGTVQSSRLHCQDFGLAPCAITDLQGGSAANNAEILISTLKGQPGPVADTLIFNAGVANYLYKISPSIASGIQLAREVHRRGQGYHTLQKIREVTHSYQTSLENQHA